MNLGATVTVASNSSEGQAPPTQPANQSEQAGQGQTSPPQTSPSNQQAGQGQAGPRVIRISHQAVPVVMMQMNTDGVLSPTRHWLNAPLHESCLCVILRGSSVLEINDCTYHTTASSVHYCWMIWRMELCKFKIFFPMIVEWCLCYCKCTPVYSNILAIT